jgi:4a-hydroxytetrahydrobiopterin dehydratase
MSLEERTMPKPIILTEEEIAAALAELDGWAMAEGKLHRELRFPNFTAAFGFMTSVALEAEKMDHHPDWFNAWTKVVIDLVTHCSGNAITSLDVELARRINAILGEQP